ncbi:hypothetical protein GN244_ATG02369 [Phytophthora infestans]|uniref:Uncharacterized protein n=1 Tax=Phytophthora infestans TaxID=4787 RepID=A0A833SBU2_PHYIN|nr:hypothetical protein GN244_ATG02369 [Phytophthora infestans]
MFVIAVLMTVAFLVDVPALYIVFTTLYVITFGVTLGLLVWCGVAYPYIADALDDYSYLPFVALMVIFFRVVSEAGSGNVKQLRKKVQRDYKERYRDRQ